MKRCDVRNGVAIRFCRLDAALSTSLWRCCCMEAVDLGQVLPRQRAVRSSAHNLFRTWIREMIQIRSRSAHHHLLASMLWKAPQKSIRTQHWLCTSDLLSSTVASMRPSPAACATLDFEHERKNGNNSSAPFPSVCSDRARASRTALSKQTSGRRWLDRGLIGSCEFLRKLGR